MPNQLVRCFHSNQLPSALTVMVQAIDASSLHQVDITPFLSKQSEVWKPSSIRGLFPLELIPGMISFLAGKPNPNTFPFESITINLKKPIPSLGNGKLNGDTSASSIDLSGAELAAALQYGATSGHPPLIKWMEEFQEHIHKRDRASQNWRMAVGCGSQDCLSRAMTSLVDAGDSVLFETPAYSGTIGAMAPNGANLVEVQCTSDGLDPESLSHILANWDTERPNMKRPRILYTIPVGSNPTGYSIPEAKKIEILKLVKKYDLLLLEDDAYAFVYYGPSETKARSYFSLEPEVNGEVGRVVRFDSFSKILSAGLRIGFITASKPLVDRMDLITANTHLQTPSTTQVMVYKLLESWGHAGLVHHCAEVADFYRGQRDMFEAAATKHLSGVAEWSSPIAGMFLWIKLILRTDGIDGDSHTAISEKAVEKGILAVPGFGFLPSRGKSTFVRTSFSLATPEQAELGFARLREAIDEIRASACSSL